MEFGCNKRVFADGNSKTTYESRRSCAVCKKTGNTEFPFIEVDINFSLGNTPSEGSALLREMIENSVEYNGKVPMKVPDGALFFLHLIMHQYKESCLMFMVERNKDLDLYKLADIYYLLKADVLDYERLEMLVKRHSLNQEVGTVLKQVGEILQIMKLRIMQRNSRALNLLL